MIASTALGRWGGLDFFLYHLFIKPFCAKLLLHDARAKDEQA